MTTENNTKNIAPKCVHALVNAHLQAIEELSKQVFLRGCLDAGMDIPSVTEESVPDIDTLLSAIRTAYEEVTIISNSLLVLDLKVDFALLEPDPTVYKQRPLEVVD